MASYKRDFFSQCHPGGVNSKKHPQNMRAGYYYNPALQNLQCLILGLVDLILGLWAPTTKRLQV